MNYDDKNLVELTKNEIIALHLDTRSFTKDFKIISTLGVALEETQHCISFNRANQIMPCLGAFAILDQIGNTYTRNDIAPYGNQDGNTIKKALYYFCEFEENDNATKSLYAFRNALVHNASLLNKHNGKFHHFRYDLTIPSVVMPAEQEWDGEMNTINDKTSTIINPKQLVERLHRMFKTLSECLEAGTLNTKLDKTDIISQYLLLLQR